ncbi:MAG: Chromate resistance protein ChrB [Bryobacteraceae bacterium]
MAPPGTVTWLVLAYRLPAASALKAAIRRKLTRIGAVYLVNAVAVLPASPGAERTLRRTRKTITEAGGSAELLRADAVEGAPALIAAFNAARDREYGEIIAACDDLLARIEAMTTAGRFSYRDLGDMDAELKRLSMRNDTIRARDVLGAANADLALSALARCRAVVDDFAVGVYQTDSASVTGVVHRPRSPGASS